jgi:predicted amidophosphoribosyltransferase
MNLSSRIHSASFLSYSWGRSASPAYAFKHPEKFKQPLRNKIMDLFGWMAQAHLAHLSDSAVVIGVPPQTTKEWRRDDHLDDLLCAIEQVNFRVSRNVLAYENERLVVADAPAAGAIRNKPVIVVDNAMNTRHTASNVADKLAELGASEVHLCIMTRLINDLPEVIQSVREFRTNICPDPTLIEQWYRSAFRRG